jgi:transposase-like protein
VILGDERKTMKAKVQDGFVCEKCGRNMSVENKSKARYTLFVLWKCSCGYQHLQKKHMPVVQPV